jgi:hypothetical protein
MQLRDSLTPPDLDSALVAELAHLASDIDGSIRAESELLVQRFNALSGLELGFSDFQGIHGAEEHDMWVRRALLQARIRPTPDVTRAELVEVARRLRDNFDNEFLREAYLQVLQTNVPHPAVSDLVYFAPRDRSMAACASSTSSGSASPPAPRRAPRGRRSGPPAPRSSRPSRRAQPRARRVGRRVNRSRHSSWRILAQTESPTG